MRCQTLYNLLKRNVKGGFLPREENTFLLRTEAWSLGQFDEVFVNKDAYAVGYRWAANNVREAWAGS